MPVRRKLFADEGCSDWADREVIIISDDEDDMAIPAETEKIVYRDIYEVSSPATPMLAPVLEEDEDPDEEWDEEAAAYDAAILDAEDQMIDVEDEPEPDYDPAWAEPAPALDDIQEGDVVMADEIGDMPHPLYDFDAKMIVGLVQTAAAEAEAAATAVQEAQVAALVAEGEVQAMYQAMETQAQMHGEEVVAIYGQLEAEQRRTASLATSLEVARTVAESTEERMGSLQAAVAASYRDLAGMVDRFDDFPSMHTPFIAKEYV